MRSLKSPGVTPRFRGGTPVVVADNEMRLAGDSGYTICIRISTYPSLEVSIIKVNGLNPNPFPLRDPSSLMRTGLGSLMRKHVECDEGSDGSDRARFCFLLVEKNAPWEV